MGCYEQNSISKYEIISKQKVGFTLFYTEIKRSFNNLEFFWYYQSQQYFIKTVCFLITSYIQIEHTISSLWETSKGALKYKNTSCMQKYFLYFSQGHLSKKVDTDFPRRYLNSVERMVHIYNISKQRSMNHGRRIKSGGS